MPQPLLSSTPQSHPDSWDELSAISDPTVNLVICRRSAARYPLGARELTRFDDISGEFSVATLASDLTLRLSEAGYDEPDITLFADDIAMLATRFARIMDVDRVAIRLEVVETDACRRFHADHVSARLICTYVGPGTQWLDAADAVALAAGADPRTLTIRQIETSDVAIFKGRLWAPDAPAIHRSPPIAGTGVQRLMLVIDPAVATPIAHA